MPTAIEVLEQRLGKKWRAIAAAKATTDDLVARLTTAVGDLGDPNVAVVTTGSLGRGEATQDSDADWVLLVDGLSNPDHAVLIRQIGDRIREILPKEVGPTGTFGDIVVSHQLVHYIAGTRDTNENLTRRILLLSESRALSNPIVRERVIRNVLARYVVNDRSVASRSGRRQTIPHFFLHSACRPHSRADGGDSAGIAGSSQSRRRPGGCRCDLLFVRRVSRRPCRSNCPEEP